MPLVRISLREDTPQEIRRSISDGIHQALVATAGVAETDRLHVISPHAVQDFIVSPRHNGIDYQNAVFIEISFIRGRNEEKKLHLYRAIRENLSENAGKRPQDIVVVLQENERVDWSMGNGEAQFLVATPRVESHADGERLRHASVDMTKESGVMGDVRSAGPSTTLPRISCEERRDR
jgi:4-oxalocrotonate tautomerase